MARLVIIGMLILVVLTYVLEDVWTDIEDRERFNNLPEVELDEQSLEKHDFGEKLFDSKIPANAGEGER